MSKLSFSLFLPLIALCEHSLMPSPTHTSVSPTLPPSPSISYCLPLPPSLSFSVSIFLFPSLSFSLFLFFSLSLSVPFLAAGVEMDTQAEGSVTAQLHAGMAFPKIQIHAVWWVI